MCGIAGIVEFDTGRQPSVEMLQRMAGVLAHRGPDEEGFYRSGSVGMAHRRLRIIDLVSGQQPMESPDGQVCVVFNGEIYNYPELKKELEHQGYVFRSRSDTEVLLALYLRDGIEAFPKINGMFACAFWDRRRGQLVLARDRFGKKPLFYYQDAKRLVFGSEIKALLASGLIERAVDLGALHEYLTYSYSAGDQAIIRGIRRLPPAHLLVLRNGQATCRRYWELQFDPDPNPPAEQEVVERVESLVREAVKRRLMSDVPLGAFLSGGLDSSVVVALMASLSDRPIKTFTIGFEEQDYSELEDARLVAKHLGTDHHETTVTPSAMELLPELAWYLDEPFGDSSAIPTYYVCRGAREHVTVALSGDGGDETFAGYTRYQELGEYQRMGRVPAWIRRGIVKPLANILPFEWPAWNALYALGISDLNRFPGGMDVFFPYIRDRLYTPDVLDALKTLNPSDASERLLRGATHLDPVSRFQCVDTQHYLPGDILTKVDRMSMANALEVRSPLLDHTLVEYMATLPVSFKLRGRVSKYVLRKLAEKLLPSHVLNKRKQGFALPKGHWFQHQHRETAAEILLDPRTISRGYFREATIRRVLRHHATGHRDYSTWIWCLIVLETWFRIFLDEQRDLRTERPGVSPRIGGEGNTVICR